MSPRTPSTPSFAHAPVMRSSSRSGQPHRGQAPLRVGEPGRQRLLRRAPALGEGPRVGLERQSPADDLGALAGVVGRADLDAEAEAVQQLRAQVALLDVHRPDEDEPGVVLDGHRLALDPGDPGRGGVEQRVDEVVGQEVDLVDVEDAAVGAGEQARLERVLAGQRAPEVERADEPVERRADRQLDERRGPLDDAGAGGHHAARRAFAGGEREGLTVRRRDRREQRSQAAHGRRLRRAALPAHEHPAHVGRDGVDQQRLDERLLADDRAQREGDGHDCASSSSPSRAR